MSNQKAFGLNLMPTDPLSSSDALSFSQKESEERKIKTQFILLANLYCQRKIFKQSIYVRSRSTAVLGQEKGP